MRGCYFLLGVVALSLGLGLTGARSEDSLLGKRVLIDQFAAAELNGQTVDPELLPFTATATQIEGEWLWIGRAWVHREDVTSLEDRTAAMIKMCDLMEGSESHSLVAFMYLTSAIRCCTRRIQCGTRLSGTVRGGVCREWLNLASAGRTRQGVPDYNEAIRLDPQVGGRYAFRGALLFDQGKSEEAYRDYAEAKRLDSEQPEFSRHPADMFRSLSRGLGIVSPPCALLRRNPTPGPGCRRSPRENADSLATEYYNAWQECCDDIRRRERVRLDKFNIGIMRIQGDDLVGLMEVLLGAKGDPLTASDFYFRGIVRTLQQDFDAALGM